MFLSIVLVLCFVKRTCFQTALENGVCFSVSLTCESFDYRWERERNIEWLLETPLGQIKVRYKSNQPKLRSIRNFSERLHKNESMTSGLKIESKLQWSLLPWSRVWESIGFPNRWEIELPNLKIWNEFWKQFELSLQSSSWNRRGVSSLIVVTRSVSAWYNCKYPCFSWKLQVGVGFQMWKF